MQVLQRWGRGGAPHPIFLMLNLFDVEGLCCPSMLPSYRGSLGSFYRFFGVFLGVLNFFQRTFEGLTLRWLGVLVPCSGQNEPKPPYLWSTSPYFGLQTHFGICIVVWVAAARRKKRRVFFGVSPSQRRLNDFQLYSVLVSYLKEIRVAGWWWWRSLGKKLCGVNHGKRICMANETLV